MTCPRSNSKSRATARAWICSRLHFRLNLVWTDLSHEVCPRQVFSFPETLTFHYPQEPSAWVPVRWQSGVTSEACSCCKVRGVEKIIHHNFQPKSMANNELESWGEKMFSTTSSFSRVKSFSAGWVSSRP